MRPITIRSQSFIRITGNFLGHSTTAPPIKNVVDKRDELKKYLEDKGVTCLIHYPISIAETDALKDKDFKDIDKCILNSKQILSLPMYPKLTKEEIDYVCMNIKKFFFLN